MLTIETMLANSLVVVTGASRGIGRAIAVAIAEEVGAPSRQNDNSSLATISSPLHVVLIARSHEKLQETANLVEKRCGGLVTTSCHEIDMSDLETLEDKLHCILEPLSEQKYDSCVLVNNHGSVEPLGFASDLTSMKELQESINLNVTSCIWMSSQFTKMFMKNASSSNNKTPLVRIVNISSICALDPFPTMSIYCAGKAGRDMFHNVLAKEDSSKSDENNNDGSESDGGSIIEKQRYKVLNYAPGPCDTEMTDVLSNCPVLDDELQNYFKTAKLENKLVRPEETAKKLVGILTEDDFESGTHIDYYDV